jgi:hypothetical protein
MDRMGHARIEGALDEWTTLHEPSVEPTLEEGETARFLDVEIVESGIRTEVILNALEKAGVMHRRHEELNEKSGPRLDLKSISTNGQSFTFEDLNY